MIRSMRIAQFVVLALVGWPTLGHSRQKLIVKVRIEKEITSFATSRIMSDKIGTASTLATFLNVTLIPDKPIDKFKNNGQWCIYALPRALDQIELERGATYDGWLEGGILYLQITPPMRNLSGNKPAIRAFTVVDEKWMKGN